MWALFGIQSRSSSMSLPTVSFPATADDVRDARRVLASWSLNKYLAIRDEQRAKGEAPRDLVWLRHNATLEEALHLLSAHKILSAPICDAYSGDFMGFFVRAGRVGYRTCVRVLTQAPIHYAAAVDGRPPKVRLRFLHIAARLRIALSLLTARALYPFCYHSGGCSRASIPRC